MHGATPLWGDGVGRITVCGYPPSNPRAMFLLAKEPHSGECSRASSLLREAMLACNGADLVRDSRGYRRDSRMRSATLPHPHHSHVGARPAREIAGRARSYRLPGSAVFLPVGADLVRDSRISPARIADEIRYRLPESTVFLPVGADLVRDSRRYRRGSRMRSAPTPPHPRHSHVGARPARDFVGRKAHRCPGTMTRYEKDDALRRSGAGLRPRRSSPPSGRSCR